MLIKTQKGAVMRKLVLFLLLPCVLQATTLEVVTEQFNPYQQVNPDGTVGGVHTHRVRQILDKAGLEYHIELMPWARAYKTALDQPNVLIYSLLRTDERIAEFQWLVPLCPLQVSFYRASNRSDIHATSIDDATQYVVGVEQGQANYQFLKHNGFRDGSTLQVVGHNHQLTEMLNKGRVDLMLVSDVYVQQLPDVERARLQRLFPVHELEKMLYLATALTTDAALVKQIKQAAEQIPLRDLAACPVTTGTD
jgi:polar amino acid transport system substrate-binding protein